MAATRKRTTKSTIGSIEVILDQPSPKKHVVRFDASDPDAAISNVYVSKLALKDLGDPDGLRITIEAL